MLWIQGFHVIFVVCWFAGLFYLPRILGLLRAKPSTRHQGRTGHHGTQTVSLCHALYAPRYRAGPMAPALFSGSTTCPAAG